MLDAVELIGQERLGEVHVGKVVVVCAVEDILEHRQCVFIHPDAVNIVHHWVEADARSFHLDREFRLILETGSTFQHLLERADQEAMLSRVREHLVRGGYFVVSAVFPRLELMQDLEGEEDWFTYEDEQGQEVRVSGTQHYDPLSQVKVETAYRRWYDAQGREIVKEVPLALRLIFPQEMELLLHCNGFEVVERYGDWDGSPLTVESGMMIYVCRKIE